MNKTTKNAAAVAAAKDEWRVLPSGLTVIVRPMPGYSSVHAVYATKFGSIDRKFRLGENEVDVPAGVVIRCGKRGFARVG